MAQQQDCRHQVSALMDGEIDAQSVAAACAAWRDDAELRSRWHAWHLIGDVLRSDELASPAQRDAAFVAALRARLCAEPVVLAPQPAMPAPSRAPSRRAWTAAGAVAAGFAVVASAVFVLDVYRPAADAPVLAGAPQSSPVQAVVNASSLPGPATPVEPQFVVADGKLIRDARLDRYLSAHKPFGRSPALAVSTSKPAAAQAGETGGQR